MLNNSSDFFQNKTILITGASRGIGKAFAEQAALRKMHLVLVSRKFSQSDKDYFAKLGALSVDLVEADLSQIERIDKLMIQINQNHPRIDFLINNAGVLTGGLFEQQNMKEIETLFQTNVLALIKLTHFVLPQMLKNNFGVIVNNASVSGEMFLPCASTYSASKAAVVAFTKSLQLELKSTRVRASVLITPGVKTNMYDDISKLYGQNMDLKFLHSIPAESWAKKVFVGIENGEEVIKPSGATRLMLFINRVFPWLFEKITLSQFHR